MLAISLLGDLLSLGAGLAIFAALALALEGFDRV